MSIRTHIRSIGAALFILAIIIGCGGSGDINYNVGPAGWSNWPWPWQTEAKIFVSKNYSETIIDSGLTNLWLNGINGEVTITGIPGRGLVSIIAEVRVGSTTLADAQEGLNQLDVLLTDNGSDINVRTSQPSKSLDRQYIVNYNITVPSDLPVSVNLVNGHVTFNGLKNSTFITLENGSVYFNSVSGDTTVSIDNGTFIGSMSLNPDSEALISIVIGDIDLNIPTTTSAELFAQVNNGSITWENLDLLNVQATSKTLQGILGDGAGLIDLETVNGNISIIGL